MSTPVKPRPSAIPTPGRVTAIPTPGTRSRSSSSVYQPKHPQPTKDDITRALAEAIRANDPSQHRPIPLSATSSTSSLSPQTLSHSLSSGRRSVAGRPSSAASTSSTKVPERAKTPGSIRPISRPPSRQSDASSRLSRNFEIGDNVRIESLGFEGTLRYIGEIDNKNGLWAGVELSGGFAGKGKNNGSVSGKRYFSCPEKCGVFVATTKLSAPTVGPGAVQRPSSVASSRGGRATPSLFGRTTPASRTPSLSFSNGRVTPSYLTGRITPGNGVATRGSLKTPTTKSTNGIPPLTNKITEGSRAAKYVNMTAQQLGSRDLNEEAESPTRWTNGGLSAVLPSPTISRSLSSPSRSTGSPFSTPRAGASRLSGIGGLNASPSLPSSRGHPSTNPPRPRLPSSVAMPPPPSPQHQHNVLITTSDAPSTMETRQQTQMRPYSRPSSSASFRSTATDDVALVEQLRSRLAALEYENDRLRTVPDTQPGTDAAQLEHLQLEKQKAIDRVTELDVKLVGLEQELESRTRDLESRNQELTTKVEDLTSELERSLATLAQETQVHSTSLNSLQDRLLDLERLNSQQADIISGHLSDIQTLETDLSKAHGELEEERKELSGQIDELRVAGQETIALYEERLSGAKSEKFELEQQISTLESRLRAEVGMQERVTQQNTPSAAQIDNETLRDQVQYLQKRSAKLEEQLEEARAAVERDVFTYQEKIGRIRMEEEQRRRDLLSKSKEVEQLIKSESRARSRVEETEEALRESTVALENTRGEVESLRAELANLDVLIDGTTEGDITSRLTSFVKRAASEKIKLQQEINRMEQAMETKASSPKAEREELTGLKHIVQELQKENMAAMQKIKLLQTENQLVSNANDIDGSLHQMKEQKTHGENELEQMRKRLNETEIKNAQIVDDLNKEISELETLVESKIYREDELEQEVERLKDKLARKKASKNSTDTPDGRNRTDFLTHMVDMPLKNGGAVCEICERPGHDILNCNLLKEDSIPTKPGISKELFCIDCETLGHDTSECPHSLDVF